MQKSLNLSHSTTKSRGNKNHTIKGVLNAILTSKEAIVNGTINIAMFDYKI